MSFHSIQDGLGSQVTKRWNELSSMASNKSINWSNKESNNWMEQKKMF